MERRNEREPRAVTILKHSLRKLIKEANEQTGPRWGKSLRGKSAKSTAAEKARRYPVEFRRDHRRLACEGSSKSQP